MDEEPQVLAKEIAAIKERNHRVEADKAWERSGFRILSIAVITYIIASAVMYAIGIANYLLSAQEEGIVYASATVPMRRIRYQFLDTAQWKGGDDHTVVDVIVPKEGTVLVPLNVH